MKLDKQEIIGVVTAVEQWFTMNHEDRLIGYEERLSAIKDEIKGIAGVESDLEQVDQYYVTSLEVKIDTETVGKTAQDVADELDAGSPRIWVSVAGDDTISVNSHTLNEGEHVIVADRLRTALGG